MADLAEKSCKMELLEWVLIGAPGPMPLLMGLPQSSLRAEV